MGHSCLDNAFWLVEIRTRGDKLWQEVKTLVRNALESRVLGRFEVRVSPILDQEREYFSAVVADGTT
jgi:hypothetical protein